jgi:cyclohexyl-isocyanide hydratase
LTKFRIGFLVFPDMTQLDMTGPHQIFALMPGAEIHLVAKSKEPVKSIEGLLFQPSSTYMDAPACDIFVIPGGPGINDLLTDQPTLDLVRWQAAGAKYMASVCTGALLLGAVGLLKGKRATTHWLSLDMLKAFGAEPVNERIVIDGSVVTGGGVTAGIDFALQMVAELVGDDAARTIQLTVEYDPRPPFDSGNPARASKELVAQVTKAAEASQVKRQAQVDKAAAALPKSDDAAAAAAPVVPEPATSAPVAATP